MRILLIHNYYQQAGGEDVVFETESNLLREKNHPVETLTFHNQAIRSPLDKIRTAYQAFYNRESAVQLAEKVRAFSPDMIHLHNFFPVASPSIIRWAARAGIPLVMTLHNFRLICANALLFRDNAPCEQCLSEAFPISGIRYGCYRNSRLQTAAVNLMVETHHHLRTWQTDVSQYIVLTEFARQQFLKSKLALRPEQISVKPNFVFDAGAGDPAEREPFFLYAGRLGEEKGIRILLDAAARHGFPLKIIGVGPLEGLVKDACLQHPAITFLGKLAKPDVLAQMKKARALIFPSIWYEGFPMTLAEALSCGTPVIAPEIGGIPEIIRDGVNGRLFPAGSVSELVERIRTFQHMGDEAYAALCHQARSAYLEHYTPETHYQQIMTIYQKAIYQASIPSRSMQLP